MTSPLCTVNGGSTTNGVNVTAGSSATIALADTGGVTQWSLSCIGTDETTTTSAVNAVLSVNQVSKTATLNPVPAAGTAMVFQSQVNNGQDINGRVVAAYTTTFALFVPLTNSLRTAAINETTEGDASYGWTSKFNALVRNTAFSLASADAKSSVRLATTGNHGLSGLAAIDSVTPVSGDRILARQQSTPSQNGVYIAASGSWTRATDFDESGEVTCGAALFVEEGSIYGLTTWVLTTSNPITVGSTSLTFRQSPAVPFSTTPAQSGMVRIGNGEEIKSRNAAGSLDYRLIASDSSDNVLIGDAVAASVTSNVKTGGVYIWNVNGATAAALGSAALSLTTVATIAWADTIAAPNILQATKTGDTAPQDLIVTPQAPFATATGSNRKGGDLIIGLADPTNGGTSLPRVRVKEGSSTYVSFGRYDSATTHGGYWAGTPSPTQQNFCFLGDGSTISYLNVPTGGQIELSINGTAGTGITVKSTDVTLAPATLQFIKSVTPTIKQLINTADVACNDLTIESQTPFASATGTNRNPGNLVYKVPSPAAGGAAGKHSFLVSGSERASLTDNLFRMVTTQQQWLKNTATYGTTTTFDMTLGNLQVVTLSGGNITTLNLNNMKDGGWYLLVFIQDGSGNRTLTVPGTMKPAGAAFTLSTGANKRDQFWGWSDGTNLYEAGRAMNV